MYKNESGYENVMDCSAMRRIVLCKNNPIYMNEAQHGRQCIPEHDYVYVESGELEIYQDDVCYTALPEDLLAFHAGHVQHGEKSIPQGTSFMFLHITVSPKDRLIAPGCDFELPENCVTFPVLLHCKRYPRIQQYFREIILNSWVKTDVQDLRNSALINLLLCEIAAASIRSSLQCDSMAYDVMQRIHATPNHFYRLDELAGIYGVSSRTLSMRFVAASGYTIHQYQLHVKLELAHTMLCMNSKLSIQEVAHTFDFYDEFHFSRMFKREFGYSPKEARDNHDLKRKDTGFRTPFSGVPL